MKLILTNDDGIFAPGLMSLFNAFREDNEVTVIAPDRERSAVGHGITLREPVRIHKVSLNGAGHGYAVTGTPADCIKMGVPLLFDEKPDLVISGINPGSNMGVNINYSGTVAAAREAALMGMTSIAVSIHGNDVKDFCAASVFAVKIARETVKYGLPYGTFLNVNLPNIPMEEIKGVRINRHYTGIPRENIDERKDPRNSDYYWYGLDPQEGSNDDDSDASAVSEGYIAVTPVRTDMTDYGLMEEMDGWNLT